MIYRYSFKNFFSFGEECEVSFIVPEKARDTDFLVRSSGSDTGIRLSKVMAVIGPNASGKTNVIKPLVFLHWFVGSSFASKPDAGIPLEPHVFFPDAPTEFEIEFDFDGAVWKYMLSIFDDQVLSESLYRKSVRTNAYNYVFRRVWDSKSKCYDIRQKGFGFNPGEARKVRSNVSLISAAAQYGIEIAMQISSLPFSTNVDYSGRAEFRERIAQASEHFFDNGEDAAYMSKLVKRWDLGIQGVDVREIEVTDSEGKPVKVRMPYCHHVGADKAQKFDMHLYRESSGTQGVFVLLSRLLPVLRNGGVAVIDELEAELHPHMLNPILDLFASQYTNNKNAQIIFTCHAVEVLKELQKSQVLLVEKDENLNSSAWRLDTVKGVRADDNLYAKYMAGAYSAIPEI